ncbi:hypothetical protein ACLF3G_28105 [Falsiroseomonas sp. HC035]|uniref:hypothetical protein n=1 Tax=Falsiroseomonas sp. HC035 TaxID=3390999 RepID=UPI003D3133F1
MLVVLLMLPFADRAATCAQQDSDQLQRVPVRNIECRLKFSHHAVPLDTYFNDAGGAEASYIPARCTPDLTEINWASTRP